MIIAPRRDQPLTGDQGTPSNRFSEYMEDLANTTNSIVSSQDVFTPTNASVLRTFDANTVTVAELADYIATLTDVLRNAGIVK
jgi:hypothetical protein